jgi:hypothetical protein
LIARASGNTDVGNRANNAATKETCSIINAKSIAARVFMQDGLLRECLCLRSAKNEEHRVFTQELSLQTISELDRQFAGNREAGRFDGGERACPAFEGAT